MKICVTLYLLLTLSLACFGQADNIRILEGRLPTIRDSTQYVDVLNRLAMLLYEQSADSTAYYASKAREISTRIDYPRGLADAANNMGVTAQVQGDVQTALHYYNDAHIQYTALKDSSDEVQTLMNIAMVYGDEGKPEKAKEEYRLAFALGKQLSYDSIVSLLIYNYLLHYSDQVGPVVANMEIAKAMSIATRYHDRRLLLAIQQLRANYLISEGKRDSGIALMQQAAQQGEAEGLFYMSLDILVALGDLCVKTDAEQGVGYYKQALAITEEKKFNSYEPDIVLRLFNFYSEKRDTAQAYYYSQKLLHALLEKEEINKKQGLDYIDYERKDEQLAIARQRSDYNARIMWLALIACALAVAIILLLWLNARRKKETHMLLQNQYTRLESISESLDKRNQQYARLLKVVAHDLRNPIGGIQSVSSMMLQQKGQDTQMVRMIHEASSGCLRLIGELLDTDLEIKKESLQKERVTIAGLLQGEAELLDVRAREKKQSLVIKADVAGAVNVDKEKIKRVIDNLVVNAIKFSPAGAVITIAAEEKQGHVILSVRDEGIGVPPAMAKQLFDPFTSAKRKGTAGEQTYGLGLFICKQIVEAHDGEIWFESEENKGSTFFIRLARVD